MRQTLAGTLLRDDGPLSVRGGTQRRQSQVRAEAFEVGRESDLDGRFGRSRNRAESIIRHQQYRQDHGLSISRSIRLISLNKLQECHDHPKPAFQCESQWKMPICEQKPRREESQSIFNRRLFRCGYALLLGERRQLLFDAGI